MNGVAVAESEETEKYRITDACPPELFFELHVIREYPALRIPNSLPTAGRRTSIGQLFMDETEASSKYNPSP